jgi:integrase
MNPPTKGRYNKAATIKGIFKANYCPLNASLPAPSKPERTRQISHGILEAIYDNLPRDELRAIIDLQAFAGERVACLCALTTISSWEDFDDRYTLIRIKARNTKARYDHVSIIPKPLADYLRAYAKTLGRSCPFPNYETLWREIRGLTLEGFGIRLTSHYLRKRYASIAAKTRMPVNSWDYLMGDKPSLGHHAEAYSLEDYSSLVEEYDRYLAPCLPIKNHKEPDEPISLVRQTPEANTLLRTIETLQETVRALTLQLTEARTH